jgi:hypothetical protein
MPAITLKAHFDGQSIKLDEPYSLLPDAQLLVTVLSPTVSDPDLAGWYEFSARGLARAYGENEPDYSSADLLP